MIHDKRQALLTAPVARWLGIEATQSEDVFVMRFAEHHIGNPFIRAIHGGVVGSLIEMAAELYIAGQTAPGSGTALRAQLVSSAIDYLRVTKDADMFARAQTVRIARRLAFVDVWCWQDSENLPVARGSCTLRIFQDS